MFAKNVKNAKAEAQGGIKLLKFAPIDNFFSPTSPVSLRFPERLISIGEKDSENWSDEDDMCYHGNEVCHHHDCQETHQGRPLTLCADCDRAIHGSPRNSGHLRFDVMRKQSLPLTRHQSSLSLPGATSSSNKSEDEEQEADEEEEEEGGSEEEEEDQVAQRNSKILRDSKKKNKPRRCNTEDIKEDSIPEIVHLRSQSLQETGFDQRHLGDIQTKPDRDSIMRQRERLTSSPIMPHSPIMISRVRHSSGPGPQRWGSEQHLHAVYTPDELKYTPLRRISQNQPRRSDHPVGVINKLLQIDGATNVPRSRKVSLPVSYRSDSLELDKDKKYSLGMEVFTLRFDVIDESDVEIIAAVKGVTLRDAVKSSFEKRNLDIKKVGVYLSLSNTPLPLHYDCFPLGGNSLHVKAKDDSPFLKKQISKTSSASLSSIPAAIKKSSSRSDSKRHPSLPAILDNHLLTAQHIAEDGATDSDEPSGVMTLDRKTSKSTSSLKSENIPKERRSKSLTRNNISFTAFTDLMALWREKNKESDSTKDKNKMVSQSQRNRKPTATDDSGLSDSGQQSPNNSLTSNDVAKFKDQKKKLSTFWSSPFGKSQEKEDLLRSKLDTWSTNGLPAMPDLITIGKRHFERSVFELPHNWQDLVQHQQLTKREKDHQERVWELLKTEVKYILRLSVIKDLFMCCLINLQNEGVLNEIDSERVFSNILDVHEGNALLWQDHMREVVLKSEDDASFLNPSYMKEGFHNISDLLHPYTKYCIEQEPCQEYIKKKCQEIELFKIFVEWCEAQKQCNRLKLTDLMVSPMHRLTRYKLLLEAIVKYTDDDTQKADLLMMVEKVNSFAKQVDNAMRQKQEQSRLSRIISRIESYEAVEAPTEECARLIGQYNRIDLTWPMQGCSSQQKRHLIREGALKLRDSTIKTEVYVFLFTDMLLLSKFKERKSDRVKVIKPPMRLDHVLVYMLKDGISFLLVHLNEFNVASAMYTLHGDARNWVTEIKKAQDEYRSLWKLNLERPETGLEYLNTSDEEDEYSGDFNIADHTALSRVESMSSADVFIPNLPNTSNIARSNSDTQVRNAAMSHHDRMHSSSPLHLEDFDSAKRPRSSTYHESFAQSGLPGHASDNQGRSLSHKSLSEASEDSYSGLSLPGAASSHRRTDSKSSMGSPSVEDEAAHLPGRPDLVLEENRSKLANRRKSGAEKRYYTADHIQDLQPKEKDTSIHKRYSLNFGNNGGTEKSAALHDKTISSDSLRSMPSSSGVSSTGSLHLSPDTDIYEECESENASVSSIRYIPPMNQLHDKISEEDISNLSNTDTSSSHLDVAAVKKFSKSLPDVSALMSLSKSTPDEGITSVQLLKSEGEKKKLSHAEMRKITKNLLLNSTLEATEV